MPIGRDRSLPIAHTGPPLRSTPMVAGDAELMELVRAIVADDNATAAALLTATPALVRTQAERGASREEAEAFYLTGIGHYLYAGDTALHIAAAGYRRVAVRLLVEMGADVSARNRRGAQPLHYAVDGAPGSPTWDPAAQGAVVGYLIEAGADPNARDRSGVTPLHRAVRTRCAAAVGALLDGGADAHLANASGSTPMRLAKTTTGRGGSGLPGAKVQQAEIVRSCKPDDFAIRRPTPSGAS